MPRGRGDLWIWLSAAAAAACLLIVFGVVGLIAARGLAAFWPSEVVRVEVARHEGGTRVLLGEIVESETIGVRRYLDARGLDDDDRLPAAATTVTRELLKTGNRDLMPPEFVWVDSHRIVGRSRPDDVLVLERTEWGDAYGYPEEVREAGATVASGAGVIVELEARIARARALREEIDALQDGPIAHISERLEALRRADLDGRASADAEADRASLELAYRDEADRLRALQAELRRDTLRLRVEDGTVHDLSFADLVRAWQPNRMSGPERLAFFADALLHFLADDPREANTEGGIFPAVFGTLLMVLLMAVMVTPLGVVAALYLHEYAHQGALVRTLRIAVNNLAGVPSIVYGVFGLGFFVYVLGGSIDDLLFADSLPAPTFGTPGLLWASLTLALLTLPVVIVSTEEGLSRIPDEIRQGSLALGATRAETLRRVVLPMASPAILTGVILAVARAAGEVAPLMLVGVVKLAPQLPVDGDFPFLHLERKFMHLGFHIYDVGFQSPNVEAARPLVYATALLLVALIVGLNLIAIVLRGRLDARYRAVEI
ncbi:MAG TPA: phosphate ABC transporter permease PstA [Pseudomonadales bacterium]|nr:phosphate ABC transporter permease PstA [Pseudomonadales bacterium]